MFQVGLESFFADKDYNNSKTKVAVVSNFTGRDRNGKHLVYRITLYKENGMWKVDELSSNDIAKIHGLY